MLKTLSFQTKVCLTIFLLFAVKAAVVFGFEGPEVFRGYGEEKLTENMADEIVDEEIKKEQEKVLQAEKTITEPEVAVQITNSSGKPFHESLCITGTGDFVVTSDQGEDAYEKGTVLNLQEYFKEKGIETCSVSLKASQEEQMVYTKDLDDESGKRAAVFGIQCLSFQKGGSYPVYPGILQIQWNAQEQAFCMINYLKMEWYLPGVVSSEMPDSFGIEALKTQAVCARSYALSVLQQEGTKENGENGISWNLVDTTDDQVYMSGTVDWQAVLACQETSGQILFQGGEIIKPHYYSTSWGEAADGAVFSGNSSQILGTAAVSAASLSKDEIKAMNQEFIQTYKAWETAAGDAGGFDTEISYDRNSPWFRWNCCISLSELCKKQVKDLWVTQRGTGGAVAEMMVFYADGTAEQISGAKSVREWLGTEKNLYTLQDGSTRTGLSILPSAFFYLEDLEKSSSGEVMVQMYGGGFGHGFGVSQYGAAQMAEEGYLYTDILAYYYQTAEIQVYY